MKPGRDSVSPGAFLDAFADIREGRFDGLAMLLSNTFGNLDQYFESGGLVRLLCCCHSEYPHKTTL